MRTLTAISGVAGAYYATIPAIPSTGGVYVFNATSGPQVGAFNTTVTFPNPILSWTNQGAAASIASASASVLAIGFVNVVLGWSLVGWFWAMIWALTATGRHVRPLADYRRPDAEGPAPSWRAIERRWASGSREIPKVPGRKVDLN